MAVRTFRRLLSNANDITKDSVVETRQVPGPRSLSSAKTQPECHRTWCLMTTWHLVLGED